MLRRSSVDVISPFLDPYLDVIMSVEGTRMRLLALSTLVPGASTLIANLLRSRCVVGVFKKRQNLSCTGCLYSAELNTTELLHMRAH